LNQLLGAEIVLAHDSIALSSRRRADAFGSATVTPAGDGNYRLAIDTSAV
jgi:hypothetical protein